MKKILSLILTLCMCLTLGAVLTACDFETTDPEHTHTGGSATCTEKAVCDECGEPYGELLEHTPNEDDGDCRTAITCSVCGEVATAANASHTGGSATCAEQAICTECGMPYGELASHAGGSATCAEQAICTECGMPYGEIASHAGGSATCAEQAVCTECGEPYGELLEHDYSNGVCTICGGNKVSVGLEYTINDDKNSYSVSGIGSCSDIDIYIGKEYNGLPVVEISDGAFSGCTSLVSINIPENVSSIGTYAFYRCTSLTSINIPDGVTSIDNYAFGCCTSLTSITIPESVASIGEYAFFACASLINITIPESVASIGECAFRECTSLANIDFGDDSGLTNIGEHAFRECTSLVSITIPESVTSIGESAFWDCTSLASVDFADHSVLTSIGHDAFYNCTSLVSITIPEAVTSIESGAFWNCTSLEEINFNAIAMNDTSQSGPLFPYAGQNDIGITVTIGKTVTKIPAYLFRSSSKITSVVFEEDSVCESIGYEAFYNCTSLVSITIPESVTSIGGGAFRDCTALEEINFNAVAMNDLTSYNIYVFNNVGQSSNGIIVTIGKNVTKIPAYLFYPDSSSSSSPKITSVVFEEGSVCESIGDYAFAHCTSLINITIPESVTSIGSLAFYDCTSLTSVEFGENSQLTSIGYRAFQSCTSLASITIPESVTSIGNYAFYDCTTSLKSIVFEDTSTWYRTESSTDWSNKMDGEPCDVTDASENARCFKYTYCHYYWYKL